MGNLPVAEPAAEAETIEPISDTVSESEQDSEEAEDKFDEEDIYKTEVYQNALRNGRDHGFTEAGNFEDLEEYDETVEAVIEVEPMTKDTPKDSKTEAEEARAGGRGWLAGLLPDMLPVRR